MPFETDPCPCPVCRTETSGIGATSFTAQDSADHFCTKERNADRNRRFAACIRRLWERETCQTRWCPACGFGFGWPFVGGDEEFYSILHEQHGYPQWRWEYDLALNAARTRFPAGGAALDIGTGDGGFLLKLPEGWSRGAIESTETLRAVLASRGIEVYRDADDALAKRPGGFQLVTLFQVIEHVQPFRQLLADVRRLVAPGGVAVISCPDGESQPARSRITGLPDMPPNHINKWTRASMEIALREAGLELVKAQPEPPALRHFLYTTELHIRAQAFGRPRSLAGRAQRIKTRRWRAMVLRAAGVLALPRMLPHWGVARLSGNLVFEAKPGVAQPARVIDAAIEGKPLSAPVAR